eukprot:TRINITY_DN3097_c0_g1_i1.p1 TRINITY_DN3097_c0_g1~~TRINITY_DN3097_c0_g1_i1.p1  ORF type:complete len:104 (+),score=13.41 TRINITY_DN3097_c0_g1_i1:291-602(+)
MLWGQVIFKYLRVCPEDHYFLLTEPPLNQPENRQYMAEIFFETFNVPGLAIYDEAPLILGASWTSCHLRERSLTGVIVSSGNNFTIVSPVVLTTYFLFFFQPT